MKNKCPYHSTDMISIIVPIYNAQSFLRKCLLSIIHQTYDNLEIILVDDGSTDKSGTICDEFAKADKRIIVLHEKNGGVSIARNKGLLKATGKYCAFVDSDDWIENDCLEKLYNSIGECDLSVGGVKSLTTKGYIVHHTQSGILHFTDYQRLAEYIYGPNDISSSCAKLFKMDIIRTYNLSFDNSIQYGEDALFIFGYLYRCQAISFVSQTIYVYNRINTNSATTKYYESVTLWIQLLIEARIKLFSRFPVCDETVIGLNKYIIFWMNRIIKMHIQALDKKSSVKAIEKTYNALSGYLQKDIAVNLTGEKYEEYALYEENAAQSDFYAVYEKMCGTKCNKRDGKYYKRLISIVQKILILHYYGMFPDSIYLLKLYLILEKKHH